MSRRARVSALAALLPLALVLAAMPAWSGEISVTDAWARATVGAGRPASAYMTITNAGAAADALVGAETPVAERAELHVTVTDADIIRMRRVDRLDLPGGATVTLAPGRAHLMLIKPTRSLVEGQEFPLTLHFAHAGAVTVPVVVGALGATAPP